MTVPLKVGERWDGSTLAAWRNESAPENGKTPRVMQSPGPPPYLRLTALAGDVWPLTPNSNPRAQLTSPSLIEAGGTYRISVDLLIPTTSMPAKLDQKAGNCVEFVQFAYGPPYAGSPPLRIFTMDGQKFGLRLGDTRWGWSTSLTRDVWWHLILEFHQSATDGWYRLLVGKGPEAPVEVVPRTPYLTIQASNSGGVNSIRLNAYMSAGTAPKIGPFFFRRASLTRLS
jgi:hypothetical protein